MKSRLARFIAVSAAGILCFIPGCQFSKVSKPVAATRDINAVLAEHDKRLLATPGVVGIYVGLLDDGTTRCLKVMLARDDEAVKRSLPRELGGYRVVPEVTGVIRALKAR